MNNKKTEQVVLNERAQDLRTLLVYYSVTRVVNSFLDKSGGFSMQMFRNVRGWLQHWDFKSQMEKTRDAKKYNEKRRKWNEVLSIPHALIVAVLGRYGKSGRVKFKDALNVIGGTKYWHVVNHGQSAYTNRDGERVVKAHWSRKVYPANNKEWNRLIFTSENYHLETLRGSERVKKLILDWKVAEKFAEVEGLTVEMLEAKNVPSRVVSFYKAIMEDAK